VDRVGQVAEVVPVLRVEERHPVRGGTVKLWDKGGPSWLAVEIVMFIAWVMVVVYWATGPH